MAPTWLVAQLFRRTRVGVGFYFAPLLFNNAAQLPFHRFERVVDHFVKRLVCAVVHLSFIRNQFVAARHSYVDATPVRVSFLMRVIGLLDGDVAPVDVVTKSFQSRCIIQNEIVDPV